MYFEDHPELMDTYQMKTSPLFIVDEEVVSVGLPGEKRISRREKTQMVPQPVSGETGLVK